VVRSSSRSAVVADASCPRACSDAAVACNNVDKCGCMVMVQRTCYVYAPAACGATHLAMLPLQLGQPGRGCLALGRHTVVVLA